MLTHVRNCEYHIIEIDIIVKKIMESLHCILVLAEIIMADTTTGQAWSHHFNVREMWIELWVGNNRCWCAIRAGMQGLCVQPAHAQKISSLCMLHNIIWWVGVLNDLTQ